MKHRTTLFGAISVIALSAIPFTSAMAAAPMGFAGTLAGSYSNVSCDGCNSADVWNVNGSAAFGFNPIFGGEIDAGYNNVSSGGSSIDLWGIGGSLFWAPPMGRAGATFQYANFGVSGFNVNTYSYGVFGEYFASPNITVGLKGGGLTLSNSGSESGGYVSAALIGYIIPDVAITPFVDYTSISSLDTTNFGIGAEWLVSHAIPIAIFGGYTRSHINISGLGSGDTNTFTIGLRIYTNGNGNTLVERHRNGTLGWAGSSDFTSVMRAFF